MSEHVVNLRDFRYPLSLDVMRIDRQTRWGNPFRIGQIQVVGSDVIVMDREDVLLAYRWWLERRLQDEPDFLEPLRDKRLACWCAPLPCHGDVIAKQLYG